MPLFLFAITHAAPQKVNWLLVISSVLGTIVSVTVIVAGMRSVVTRSLNEIIGDKIQPHIDSDEHHFEKVERTLAGIEGELKGRR